MNRTAARSLVSAQHVGDRRIQITFDDGSSKVVDVSAHLVGPVFDRLRTDESAFASLFVDPQLHTVCWPGDLDLAPELLESLPDVAAGIATEH